MENLRTGIVICNLIEGLMWSQKWEVIKRSIELAIEGDINISLVVSMLRYSCCGRENISGWNDLVQSAIDKYDKNKEGIFTGLKI